MLWLDVQLDVDLVILDGPATAKAFAEVAVVPITDKLALAAPPPPPERMTAVLAQVHEVIGAADDDLDPALAAGVQPVAGVPRVGLLGQPAGQGNALRRAGSAAISATW